MLAQKNSNFLYESIQIKKYMQKESSVVMKGYDTKIKYGIYQGQMGDSM